MLLETEQDDSTERFAVSWAPLDLTERPVCEVAVVFCPVWLPLDLASDVDWFGFAAADSAPADSLPDAASTPDDACAQAALTSVPGRQMPD
ncbi:MAG: hypothetical protein LAQ30_18255 [Acidobacteriia bacterium]|nr:hypothetical protein [Terriglobia bacterium]